MQQKKICFVDPHYYSVTIGGAEVQLAILAREFACRGWDTCYLTSDLDSDQVIDGVRMKAYQKGLGFRDLKDAVARILIDEQPAIIYQRGRKIETAAIGELAPVLGSAFVFASSMSVDVRKYKELPRLFESNTGFRSLLSIPGRWLLDRRTLRGMYSADLVLAQSEMQQRALRHGLGIDSRLFRNVFPVDGKGETEKDSPPIVLWLASMKSLKRPEIFIDLARRLADLDCRFILVGRLAEESKYRGLIDTAVAEIPGLDYVGEVSFEEGQRWFRRASVFVNTSTHEGFPNVFIQSWLAGVPVISLSVDPDAVIGSNRLGRFSGNFELLVADVRDMVTNPLKRRETGKRAMLYAQEQFGLDTRFPQFEGMLEDVVGAGDI